MKDKLRRLLKSKTTKDMGIVYTGKVFNAAIGFVASIIIVRTLGASNYGLLSIAAEVMGLIAAIIGLGLDTTLVRLTSFYLQEDENRALEILRLVFKFRLIIGIATIIGGYYLAVPIAEDIFKKPELTNPIRIAFFGALGVSFWLYLISVLMSLQSFMKLTLIHVVSNSIRLPFLGIFAYFALLNITNTLLINISQAIFGFLIGLLILPKNIYKKPEKKTNELKILFDYSKWIFLASLFFLAFERLDILMLGYFDVAASVGYYAMAKTLIRPLEFLPETLNTVFLPHISKYKKESQIRGFIKNSLSITLPASSLLIPLIFLAKPLIKMIYGAAFEDSVILFQILIIGFIFSINLNPLNLLAHSINKPSILAFSNSFKLALNFGGNVYFIPLYGAIGASVVTAITRVIGGIFGLFLTFWGLKSFGETFRPSVMESSKRILTNQILK